MLARKAIYDYLTARAAALTNADAVFGLAVCFDPAQMQANLQAGKFFGVLMGDAESQVLEDSTGNLVEKDGKLVIKPYAMVQQANKTDRLAAYEKMERVRAWLIQQVRLDYSMNGALCPNTFFSEWTVPADGDALNSQPYVLSVGTLHYEEP